MPDLLFILTDEAPALELARRELAKAEESGVGFEQAAAKVAELERDELARRVSL